MILSYDIITNTRARWFHCSTIDCLHVTISAQPTLCCHCCARTRCYIQARASASVRTQDAASERTEDMMPWAAHRHTCQEWACQRTLPRVSAQAHNEQARSPNATTNVMWCMIPHNNPPQHLNLTFHMIWEGKVFMIWCYQRSYQTFSFPILQAH